MRARRNDEGNTLLSCAASARQSQVVDLLLKLGAQVNSRNEFGQTALFAAANSHSLDSAKFLVEAGADVNATDIDGDTPLLIGMGFGYRVPLYLINQGTDVNIRNKNGQGALDLCNNYVEYLRDPLIRAGAHV